MTKPDLDAIRARVEAATDGPWDTYRPRAEYRIYELCSTASQGLNETLGELSGYEAKPNAEFITHAREDVPALLAYIEQLESDLKTVQEVTRANHDSLLRQRTELKTQVERVRGICRTRAQVIAVDIIREALGGDGE